MFKKNFAIEDRAEIEKLQEEIVALKSENNELKKHIKKFTDIEHELTAAIDWSSIRAFSVERIHTDDEHKTVIGYYLDRPVELAGQLVHVFNVCEWTIDCNVTEHNRLLAEFNSWLRSNKP